MWSILMMKALIAVLAVILGAAIVFPTFSFGQATFDIVAWTAPIRGACAVYMLMVGVLCGVFSTIISK
jgi:hypothetical protein